MTFIEGQKILSIVTDIVIYRMLATEKERNRHEWQGTLLASDVNCCWKSRLINTDYMLVSVRVVELKDEVRWGSGDLSPSWTLAQRYMPPYQGREDHQ